MKKITVFIIAFFVFFSPSAYAAYTGVQIYDSMKTAMSWTDKNISPLGDTDSVASDYLVIALKRAGEVFDYNKYEKITRSRKPTTLRDAQRNIMANTASGGRLSDSTVAKYTYNAELTTADDYADAILTLLSGEYKVKSHKTDINRLAANLLSMQNYDGKFGDGIVSTSKSMIALSFLSGNCYVVKGDGIGEEYRYDVNTSLLRGIDYLQKNKAEDFGFGSVKNTAYAVMALDSTGVDADNDPGFSDGELSTLKSLISMQNPDGSFKDAGADGTAIALCALVSHLRAMQGNSLFFSLLTEDMPYNPSDYVEDFNYSGSGLKVDTQGEIKIRMNNKITENETSEQSDAEIATTVPIDTSTNIEQKKHIRIGPIIVIIITIILLTAVVTWFVVYMLNVRPIKKYHKKEDKDEDN